MTYSTEYMRDAEWDYEREPELQPSDIADMHVTEAALFLRERRCPNAPVGELREIYDTLPEDTQRRSNAWREIARIWEARQRGKGSERPIVDASYTIRTPEGRTVEVIVTDYHGGGGRVPAPRCPPRGLVPLPRRRLHGDGAMSYSVEIKTEDMGWDWARGRESSVLSVTTFFGGKRGRMVQLTISGGAIAFVALTQEQLAVLRETLDFASERSLVDHPREGIEADRQVYVCPACQGIGVGRPAHVRDCERLTASDEEGEGDGI